MFSEQYPIVVTPDSRSVNLLVYPQQYFQAQILFASRFSDITGLPLTETIKIATSIPGVISDQFPASSNYYQKNWGEAKTAIVGLTDPQSIADKLHTLYQTYPFAVYQPGGYPKVSAADYGPFSFTYGSPQKKPAIHIHFTNRKRGELSDLSLENWPETMRQMRNMFVFIRGLFDKPVSVNGQSWVYGIPAYRSLFPDSYQQSIHSIVPPPNMTDASLWGQFLNRYGFIRENTYRQFLKAVEKAHTLDELLRTFPYPVCAASAAVEDFYYHLGIS